MSNPNQWRPIGRYAITWTRDGLFFWGSFLKINNDNFMIMRPATIWRRICWANYRTQYCGIFMKFTGTDGNINTALSATYQMDMPEFFSRRWIQMNYFVNLLDNNTTYHFPSLVYNACISRWWWPTTTILQLWAESADWIISRLQFYIWCRIIILGIILALS